MKRLLNDDMYHCLACLSMARNVALLLFGRVGDVVIGSGEGQTGELLRFGMIDICRFPPWFENSALRGIDLSGTRMASICTCPVTNCTLKSKTFHKTTGSSTALLSF